MYLPHSTVPDAELSLNIVSRAKGVTVIEDEREVGKGVAVIIIDNGGELAFRLMLNDSENGSNPVRGVSIVKTKCYETQRPTPKSYSERSRRRKLCGAARISANVGKNGRQTILYTSPIQSEYNLRCDARNDAQKRENGIRRTWENIPNDERAVKQNTPSD